MLNPNDKKNQARIRVGTTTDTVITSRAVPGNVGSHIVQFKKKEQQFIPVTCT